MHYDVHPWADETDCLWDNMKTCQHLHISLRTHGITDKGDGEVSVSKTGFTCLIKRALTWKHLTFHKVLFKLNWQWNEVSPCWLSAFVGATCGALWCPLLTKCRFTACLLTSTVTWTPLTVSPQVVQEANIHIYIYTYYTYIYTYLHIYCQSEWLFVWCDPRTAIISNPQINAFVHGCECLCAATYACVCHGYLMYTINNEGK